MTTGTCQSCHTAVNHREAVVRSVSFTRVFFHRHCWEKTHGPLTVDSIRG